MKRPIRISLVSYLNSRPFLYGLRHSPIADSIELQLDIPSVCAEKLLKGTVDIGLVPVAILPELPDYRIIGDYCIGAFGPVQSVLLVSDVPLESIHTIMLDYQSRTSVTLIRILAEQLWKISPRWESAVPGFEHKVAGDRAAVIIGDRAFQASREHRFVYDLAAAWKALTGHPFVFACWVSRVALDPEFIKAFNQALASGINQLELVAQEEKNTILRTNELIDYLRDSIRFPFDDGAKKGLTEFLLRMKSI